MKKRMIISFISGALIFGTVGAFAGQYVATENPFPVQLNGNNVSIDGYNIEGSTYFKLRDIADIIGCFDVGFADDTIQLSKDGYSYSTAASGDSTQFYDVVETDDGKYYILKDNPTVVSGSNVGGKYHISVYADTYGNQYVSLSTTSDACARTGLFCSMYPSKQGTWSFKEWSKGDGTFIDVSSGDMFVDKSISDFYILLDDYTSKIAPTLNTYIEKNYN